MAKQTLLNEKARIILAALKKASVSVISFSVLINLLMLTVPIYMLQLFDRVLVSQSTDTLIYLCIIALFALAIYGLLDFLRTRILNETSTWLDQKLNTFLFSKAIDYKIQGDSYARQAQSDVSRMTQFLKSPSVNAFLDAPWFPIYLIAIFIISSVLGFLALIGAVILLALAVVNQRLSAHELYRASNMALSAPHQQEVIYNQAESIQAFGMLKNIYQHWFKNNTEYLRFQTDSAYRVSLIATISKFIRLVVQVGILTGGAYLVIKGELTGGAMIAASIITARALAPVEQSISAWKDFFMARESLLRVNTLLEKPDIRRKEIALSQVSGKLSADSLIFMPPGLNKPILNNINFTLNAGESLAVLGPSASGKSTLARLMLGVFPPTRGAIRLDGADVYTWSRPHFGEQVGYLPQDNGLIEGTIKENICCFATNVNDKKIVETAQLTNAHEMILKLPQGYDTPISDYRLSGGQIKRIALARAFYGEPKLVILDEPEANLDTVGEAALLSLLKRVIQEKAVTLVVITRHMKLIEMMNHVLVLKEGAVQAFEPTSVILEKLKK